MNGEQRLIAQLLYGTGMRINEVLQLRIKDVGFAGNTIVVREGKGRKDRALMLPKSLKRPLLEQIGRSRALWGADQAAGRGGQGAFKRAVQRAGINKSATPHTLRFVRYVAASVGLRHQDRPSSATLDMRCTPAVRPGPFITIPGHRGGLWIGKPSRLEQFDRC